MHIGNNVVNIRISMNNAVAFIQWVHGIAIETGPSNVAEIDLTMIIIVYVPHKVQTSHDIKTQSWINPKRITWRHGQRFKLYSAL